MKIQFEIPHNGNKITKTDVKNNRIRITVALKEYFPNYSTNLEIVYNSENFTIPFTHRIGRSHVLGLGKDLTSKLNLNAGCSIEMIKLEDKKYKIV